VSSHSTYESSVQSAGATQLATVATAITTHQTSIDAASSVVGYNLQTGNNATLRSTVATANAAKLEAFANAEKTKQASLAAAREALRTDNTGDRTKF
jgi:hypothetical protein